MSVSGILDAGFANSIPLHRIVSIVAYDSEPMKRYCHEADKLGKLIDATKGRKVKSVIFLDSSHVVLSAMARETLSERFENALQRINNAQL